MAKILISSLGTGQKKDGGYRKATYRLGEKEPITTTFISKALCEFLEIDKLFLVGTKGSIWDSCYAEFGGSDESVELDLYEKQEERKLLESDLKFVEDTIDTALQKSGSRCFLIEYGLDDSELWRNFQKYIEILESVDDGDIVYIDISHAFRSLALMSFLMVQFGHGIRQKRFEIGGIFYGMLEYSSENDNIAPIVDLKIFYELMEWIKAVDNFKNYANGDNISALLQNSPEFRNEYNIFNNYTNAMRIANMAAVKKNIQSISKKLKLLKESKNPIIRLMTDEMEEFIVRLNQKRMSDFQLALANWYCEHKHYALAYMALVEAIVSKSCEVHGYKIDSEDGRNSAKKKIHKIDRDLSKIYSTVNKIRNNIAHQLQKREDSIIADITNLPKYIQQVESAFKTI